MESEGKQMLNRFNNKMNSKIESSIYLTIIVFLVVVIVCLRKTYFVGMLAILVIGASVYFARKNSESKELFFSSYMDNIVRNIERANHFAISHLDVGMAVFSKNGKLQWKNEKFAQCVGNKKLEGMAPEEILPLPQNMNFDMLCVKDGELIIQINDRYYNMSYVKVETQENNQNKEKSK